MVQAQEQDNRKEDWICFLNEMGVRQEAFVYLTHFDASFVKFKVKYQDDTIIVIPTARILKIKDKREVGV